MTLATPLAQVGLLALALLAGVSSACTSTAEGSRSAALEGGALHQDAGTCANLETAFQSFLQSHSACSKDADCVAVGDCGPHSWVAVRSDVAAEANDRQQALCRNGPWDGPLYDAVCTDRICTARESSTRFCGSAPLPDAGDAGDARAVSADAAKD